MKVTVRKNEEDYSVYSVRINNQSNPDCCDLVENILIKLGLDIPECGTVLRFDLVPCPRRRKNSVCFYLEYDHELMARFGAARHTFTFPTTFFFKGRLSDGLVRRRCFAGSPREQFPDGPPRWFVADNVRYSKR
jgi:hypothetical protein